MLHRWKYSIQEGKQKVFGKYFDHFGSDYSKIPKVGRLHVLKICGYFVVFCTSAISKVAHCLHLFINFTMLLLNGRSMKANGRML